jgi:hypothetical protein
VPRLVFILTFLICLASRCTSDNGIIFPTIGGISTEPYLSNIGRYPYARGHHHDASKDDVKSKPSDMIIDDVWLYQQWTPLFAQYGGLFVTSVDALCITYQVSAFESSVDCYIGYIPWLLCVTVSNGSYDKAISK